MGTLREDLCTVLYIYDNISLDSSTNEKYFRQMLYRNSGWLYLAFGLK